MSRWRLRLPLRGRDQTIAEAIAENGSARMPDEDRAVALQVFLDAHQRGVKTTGELAAQLRAASPAQRRALLDQVREAAGLESTADIEGQEEFERANEMVRRRKQALGKPPPDEGPQLIPGGAITIRDREAEQREAARDRIREEAWEQRQAEKRAKAEAIRAARERWERETADDDYLHPNIAGIEGARWDG